MKLQIIIGSTRQNRFSEKPAKWILEQAKKRKELEVEVLDLRDWPLPFYDEALTPSRLKGKYSNPQVQKWVDKIGEADGYIVVTPEYNHGYPAVLKNALDYPYFEWNRKPIGFVSWGSALGARVIEQLRQVTVEFEMAPLKIAIQIPPQIVSAARSTENVETENPFEPLTEKSDAFLDQLLWWMKALKVAREA